MDIRTVNNIRCYSGDITPESGVVFVFGSNPEGRHGAGAAKVARERFGAIYGRGEGLQGNAYALPTKDLRVTENRGFRSISPEAITQSIKKLYETARQHPDKSFCIAYRNTDRASLNGYTGIEMMRMFAAAGPMPDNVIVSEEWAKTGKEILKTEQEPIQSAELLAQMQAVKEKTLANGSYMRTPTGEPTTLTEREWLISRTRSFRDAYGIWEKDALTAEILKNGINSVTLQLLKTVLSYGQDAEQINERVLTDHGILERISQEILREGDVICRRNDEASLILRGSEGTDSQVSPVEDYDRQVEYSHKQTALLEEWARANGIWHDNTDRTLSARYSFLAKEGEATVYYDEAENLVYKAISLDYYISPSLTLDRINIQNRLFPNDFLDIVGVGRDADGRFQFVCRQPFIRGEAPTPEEVRAFITGLGFRQVPGTDNEYTDNDIYIGDLHAGNVLKDASGILHVFDNELRLNTPGLGYGGKYILPDEKPAHELSPSGEPHSRDIIEFVHRYNAQHSTKERLVIDKSEFLTEGNDSILKQYDAYRVVAPGVNLAVDTRMDNVRDWYELVNDNGERLVRAANYVTRDLRSYDSAHFENATIGPDGSITLDAVAHSISPEGDVETSERAYRVAFAREELMELLPHNAEDEPAARKLATDTAMFLADRLNAIGVRTEVVSQEQARNILRDNPDGTEFSVADIQKLNYEWNGEQISMKVFAQTFGDLIKQPDRTMADVDRIAGAYIDSVKANPAAFIPQLKPENMSHWRYFILPDGSVYSPQHLMANNPEYETQRGLYEIYKRVLGNRITPFMEGVSRYALLSETERNAFLEMEREVSGSELMQRTLEINAEKVNERRNRDIANLIQYFDGNSDYTTAEKALILKGAMTYSYSEKKKDGGQNEVKLVRITDANDVSVPVLGGDAATIVEGLRKGLNFKDSLILARNSIDDSRNRSVARDFTGWKVYPKSDKEEDAVVLQKDAAGTGWCTGGAVSTARTHLSGGDFHIYFENGEPLIAIRTENGRLAEAPRGAHEGQFCTPREEEIAFSYIQEGHGISGGRDYIADMQDLRKLNSPDCTWRDVVRIPARRRYENGEYGGDTGSWGKAAEDKIRRIMTDSRDERFAAGYYTPQEMAEYGIPRERVKGLLNDECFTVKGDWPNLEFIKSDIDVYIKASLPSCQSVGGSVYIYANARLELPSCRSTGGTVEIHENANLDLSVCQSVGGFVEVHNNANLGLPSCQSIGRSVYIYANASLNLPVCQSVGGSIDVYKNASLDLSVCQSIGGGVYIYENASLDLPVCQSVGGNVNILENANLDLPVCQSVGRNVGVGKSASLNLPSCQSVGGGINVHKNTNLNLPSCQSVGNNVFIDANASLNLPSCQSIGGNIEAYNSASLDLPVCQSVEGYIEVLENASLDLPVCQSVGGNVNVLENANLDLPVCQSVGGNVNVLENANLKLSSCQSIGESINVLENANLKLPACQSVGRGINVHENATIIIPESTPKIDYHLSDGTVYGYEQNNTIYLTPEGINPNTPIHEYAHIWAKAMQKTNPKQWDAIKKTLKTLPAWNVISEREDYAFLRNDEDRLAGEVLATITGDRAEAILVQMAKETINTGNADTKDVVDMLKRNISGYVTEDLFGLNTKDNLTLETITLGVIKDLVAQKDILNIAPSTKESIDTHQDIIKGSDDKPLVLWHGSPAEFDTFDFSHAGENTGVTEYTNRVTGEKVTSDSDKALFFTDNRQLAISYGFLARTQQLSRYSDLLTDIGSLLNNPEGSILSRIHSKAELIDAVGELRKEGDAEMDAVLDKLPDLTGEKPLSSMAEADRKALAKDVFEVRNRYSELHSKNSHGGLSNQLNNFVRQKDYLTYFAKNLDRLCANDPTVRTEFDKDFNTYNNTFFGPNHGSGVSVFLENETRRMKAAGFHKGPVYLDTLTPSEKKDLLQKIEDDLNACIESYNKDIEAARFRQSTHLYPVHIKARNPLVHDYQGSSFPDKYIPYKKYDTAYVAARQVRKALADGNDAVVYKNIRDPFLGTTYGVFSTENIVMIDRSLLPKEQLDCTLEKVSGTVQRYMDAMERSNRVFNGNTNLQGDEKKDGIQGKSVLYPTPVTRPSDGRMNYRDANGNNLLRNWVEKAEPFRNGKANVVLGGLHFTINDKGYVIKREELKNNDIQSTGIKR